MNTAEKLADAPYQIFPNDMKGHDRHPPGCMTLRVVEALSYWLSLAEVCDNVEL
ncbi:hypothetical protein Thimo_1336 [Thioflavicoccus mobilis 8321]|uniref:Transposase n=1 Tax=Thioflavicoccus mobilis 8321 TaxID=765912 RepID=L0GXM8_9GAMM|nr:hypothetical protein [Thioflavicoccus mobilis]AGA90130.1 hypothetical protein Thimo_1336 [Thioflavicoccus mobilis 8321]